MGAIVDVCVSGTDLSVLCSTNGFTGSSNNERTVGTSVEVVGLPVDCVVSPGVLGGVGKCCMCLRIGIRENDGDLDDCLEEFRSILHGEFASLYVSDIRNCLNKEIASLLTNCDNDIECVLYEVFEGV